MYKVAIFDLDGTLLDTITDLGNACNKSLAKYGYKEHDTEGYKKFIGNGLYKLVERALPLENRSVDNINEVLEDFTTYYSKHMMDETKPYEGILELLTELKSKNLKLSVLSNKKHDLTLEIINKYFNNTFDIIIGHRENYLPKPDPTALEEIVKAFGVEKNQCIYIGDSNVDILTGKNADIKTIGVTWGFRGKEELEREDADYIVDTTKKLMNIILLP